MFFVQVAVCVSLLLIQDLQSKVKNGGQFYSLRFSLNHLEPVVQKSSGHISAVGLDQIL